MNEIPVPTFIKLNDNCLYLSETSVTDSMAIILKTFLEKSKDDAENIVKVLVLDDCAIKDHQLVEILKGITAQGK